MSKRFKVEGECEKVGGTGGQRPPMLGGGSGGHWGPQQGTGAVAPEAKWM